MNYDEIIKELHKIDDFFQHYYSDDVDDKEPRDRRHNALLEAIEAIARLQGLDK